MGENLRFSRIFTPRDGQLWRYYLYNLVTDIPRVIKYSWQRARRGWADCDTWNVDIWFLKVVPEMLDKLSESEYGYPIGFDNPYAWKGTLQQLADDLRAIQRYDDRWFGGEKPLYSRSRHDECSKEEDEAYNKVKAGLLGFHEWFFHLWD